jgi:hypothetical protein
VLEQLNTIDGVTASSANYAGTLVRVAMTPAADRDKVTEEVRKLLSAPAWLTGHDLQVALRQEEWREFHQIGQLSAIEFRTLAIGWVKGFVEAEHIGDGAADQLLDLAERVWHRLIELTDRTEEKLPPHQMDWRGRCRRYAAEFGEQAKDLLTVDQRDRIKQLLTGKFEQLIPEKA